MVAVDAPLWQGVFILAAALLVHSLVRAAKQAPPKAGPLPSPRRLPIIGSIPDMPTLGVWYRLYDWAQELGDLYEIDLAGDKLIIAGSEQVTKDLFVVRGAKYGDRPVMFGIDDSRGSLTKQPIYLPFAGMGERHDILRKAAARLLKDSRSVENFNYPIIEARRLLYRLYKSDDRKKKWMSLIPNAVDRIATRLAWGSPDPATRHRELTLKLIRAASVSTNIANAISALALLPYAVSPWKRAEKKRREEQVGWWRDQLTVVAKQVDSGKAGPSWARTLLEDVKQTATTKKQASSEVLSEFDQVAMLVGMLPALVSIATGNIATNAMRMFAAYPSWAKRVQAELDEVVGSERLPEPSDVPRLPTLRAFLRETLRIHPPTPMSFPRALQGDEDDVYRGQVIPHSQPIFSCDYIIGRDASAFPNPFAFKPERWLSPEFPTTYNPDLAQHPTIVGSFHFGGGRRVCLGQHLAATNLYMLVAHVVHAFDITAPNPEEAFGADLGPRETWGGMKMPRSAEMSTFLVPPSPCELDFALRGGEDGPRAKVLLDAYKASVEEDPLPAVGSVTVE